LKLEVDDSSDNSTAQTLAVNINQATGTLALQETGMPAGQMHCPNAPTAYTAYILRHGYWLPPAA